MASASTKRKTGMFQSLSDVGWMTHGEIVDTDDPMTLGQQSLEQIRPEESGDPGNENGGF